MKILILGTATLSLVAATASAQFDAGNLAVVRIGDGSAALTSASTSGFIDQYTSAGAFVNTLSIPSTAGSSPLTWSGSATSEGALTRSPDGTLLALAGYNSAKGVAGIASTTSASVPRGIATVNAAGTYTLAGTTAAFSGNNIRSGVTDGANNFWGAGAGSASLTGINYFGNASAAASVTNVNARVVNLFNNNLYFSSGSATRGIYAFTGTPATGATASLLLGTGSSSSPYDFALNANATVLYVADDTAGAAGGIQRWAWNGAAFGLSYTLGTGVANIGARGLAVDFSGLNPVLFAITAEGSANRLIEITDTGATSTATTLATASLNEIFRGVDFTPVAAPEPAGLFGLGAVVFLLGRKFVRRRH